MIDLTESVEFDKISKRLASIPKDAPKILATALNQTARDAQKLLLKEAKDKYTIKPKYFNKGSQGLQIRKATTRTLSAMLDSKGAPINIYNFKIRATETSTRASVKKGGGMKNLLIGNRWAFVQTMKSGHTGVFQRERERDNPGDSKIGRHGLGIHEKFSLSVPQMIGNEEEVYGKLEPEIGEILQKHVEEQIQKLFAKKEAS